MSGHREVGAKCARIKRPGSAFNAAREKGQDTGYATQALRAATASIGMTKNSEPTRARRGKSLDSINN